MLIPSGLGSQASALFDMQERVLAPTGRAADFELSAALSRLNSPPAEMRSWLHSSFPQSYPFVRPAPVQDPAPQPDGGLDASVALREELGTLRLSTLRNRAVEAGFSEEQLDEVDDALEPKIDLIDLLVKHRREQLARAEEAAAAAAAGDASQKTEFRALRAELGAMKRSELRENTIS